MKQLKSIIRTFLTEEELRIVQIGMSVSMLNDSSTVDVTTKIRALPGVVTLAIEQKATKSSTGHRIMYFTMKYLHPPGGVYEYIDALAKMMKSIEGVEIVHVYKLGGYDIKDPDGNDLVY